jgi:hypothetical protein
VLHVRINCFIYNAIISIVLLIVNRFIDIFFNFFIGFFTCNKVVQFVYNEQAHAFFPAVRGVGVGLLSPRPTRGDIPGISARPITPFRTEKNKKRINKVLDKRFIA